MVRDPPGLELPPVSFSAQLVGFAGDQLNYDESAPHFRWTGHVGLALPPGTAGTRCWPRWRGLELVEVKQGLGLMSRYYLGIGFTSPSNICWDLYPQ